MTSEHLHLKLNSENLDFIVKEAKDFASSTGLVMGVPGTEDVTFAPICLLPSPFPKEWFSKAEDVQTSLNLLNHRIAKDTSFLKNCLQKTSETDDFIRKLLDVHETVAKEGYAQNLSLGLFRMDYMLDTEGESITGMKQVEMNTIASSFGCLASGLHPLHKHLLKHLKAPEINYPKSSAIEGLAIGLVSAWRVYGVHEAIVVFVVKSDETNFSDQRLLEYSVYNIEPKIRVRRYTFDELHVLGTLKDKRFYLGSDEVSVVYYRTGYCPEQYSTESWAVRLMLERSLTIQCPNVAVQLAGTKKVQQELCRDGILKKLLPDLSEEEIQKITSLFAGQFSLDLNQEGDKAVAMALANPERYVLKPQREGGGHNLYGTEVAEALKNMNGPEREAYVLMEMISPPTHPNYIIRRNQSCTTQIDTVAELGIYGVILGDEEIVIENFVAGHLLRCKAQGVNEGGVAMGYGAINLPYLV